MAWESRQRGGRYYTRSVRQNGVVRRQYIGAGPLAEWAALEDAQRREEREQQKRAWKADRERLEALDESLEPLDAIGTELMRRCLEAAGYHQHKAGEWRKRRGQKSR